MPNNCSKCCKKAQIAFEVSAGNSITWFRSCSKEPSHEHFASAFKKTEAKVNGSNAILKIKFL